MSNKLNIKLTSQEGLTLHTEGTFCEADIAVVPHLESITVTPTTEVQNITPSAGYAGIGAIVVAAASGGSKPLYDGTVVIEKAESVLGLRRFKENLSVYGTYSVNETFEETYNKGFVTIEAIILGTDTLYGFTPLYTGSDGAQNFVIDYKSSMGERVFVNMPAEFFLQVFNEFNVLSTSNSTVDEWLLANTEGVSV